MLRASDCVESSCRKSIGFWLMIFTAIGIAYVLWSVWRSYRADFDWDNQTF